MSGLFENWFDEACHLAGRALCLRSRCGAVLVRDGVAIGRGYNGPPVDDLKLRVCETIKPSGKKPKSDRTCCLHAEWRALLGALTDHPGEVEGSTMVFVRVDVWGNLRRSGNPYCTVCSRLTLERGVKSWLLWHAGGIREYSTLEYHQLSQRYDELEAAGVVPGGFSGVPGSGEFEGGGDR